MLKWESCFAMPPAKQTFLHVALERFKDKSGATYSTVLNSLCHETFSKPKFQQLYQKCTTVVVSGRARAHLFLGNRKHILFECRRIITENIFVYQQYKVKAGNMYGWRPYEAVILYEVRGSNLLSDTRSFEVLCGDFIVFRRIQKYSN
jgi:hypothetical protein